MFRNRGVYAVLLAAGKGRRMQSSGKKQFMEIGGAPLYSYSLRTFSDSELVDGILLMTAEEDREMLSREVSAQYPKILGVFAGGRERYNTVFNGLSKIYRLLNENRMLPGADSLNPIVLIHDSARPFLTEKMIEDSCGAVSEWHASAVGMPVKDTIKVVNEENVVTATPDRSKLWQIQTPQSFDFSLIYPAYARLIEKERRGLLTEHVTDDAMVVETFADTPVRVIEGSYENIKVTTPEDVPLSEFLLKRRKRQADAAFRVTTEKLDI